MRATKPRLLLIVESRGEGVEIVLTTGGTEGTDGVVKAVALVLLQFHLLLFVFFFLLVSYLLLLLRLSFPLLLSLPFFLLPHFLRRFLRLLHPLSLILFFLRLYLLDGF